MSILTSDQIAARFASLQAKLGEVDELREQVEALMNGRGAGMRVAFEKYGGLLDDLAARVAALEAAQTPTAPAPEISDEPAPKPKAKRGSKKR